MRYLTLRRTFLIKYLQNIIIRGHYECEYKKREIRCMIKITMVYFHINTLQNGMLKKNNTVPLLLYHPI